MYNFPFPFFFSRIKLANELIWVVIATRVGDFGHKNRY